jgi:hypothetical protein
VSRVESEHTVEAVQLSRSVMEIFEPLVDLGVFPIQDIPAHSKSTQDILTVASLVFKRLQEEHASSVDPWA